MKVAFITIMDNTNFGTYLQALATGIVLQEMGCEVEVVNYIRVCMTQKGMSRTLFENSGFLRWLKHRWGISAFVKLRNKNLEFLKKYLKLSKKYESFEAIHNDPPIADIYMTGSDQVWNSYYNKGIDRAFFLDFAPEGRKRVAYSASIGMDDIPTEEVKEFTTLLKKYSFIGVREKRAKNILAKYNISSTLVLDPTLLLNKDKWMSIADSSPYPIEKTPYLLIYSVEGKRENLLQKYAHIIAEKKRLKICQVSSGAKKEMIKTVDKKYDWATPDVFLSLMLNASFVLVSSFHGTAFSLNFNKQFLTVAPRRFNSRLDSLLDMFGLQDRVIHDESFVVDDLKDIDYDIINNRLNQERYSSKQFLSKMVLE